MAKGNCTRMTEFLLLGFTDDPELQPILFVVLSMIYCITLVGNLSMVVLIWIDSRLHSPMYFFLGNLSLMDTCCSSSIIPKMLLNFVAGKKGISFSGCITQLFCFGVSATVECFLLAVMAYDRYIAICNPLLYRAVISTRVCMQLVIASYIGGFFHGILHMIGILRLSFYRSNVISHFFCDLPPLLQLSCTDTFVNELIIFIVSGPIQIFTFLIVLLSYVYILSTILQMNSAEGRRKAFSTCTSHLLSVSLFYGSLFVYIQPHSSYSLDHNMLDSLCYTIFIPMLNPLIYSLRNKEVKEAMRKAIEREIFFQ
ncbi:olfactory receptor 1094-like [Alligator sinensis]|uniref:Olfactory receptor n=1 Tax=Alligator sinensis TaxID=38654 RepID=A0A1U7RJ21_ALLSI|nr:olfactory receptor 1094-like [Alligator sinensis]